MKPLFQPKKLKLIIAGGRNINNFDVMKLAFENSGFKGKVSEIVSGVAKGADRLGELLAAELGIPVTKFPANWDRDGQSAGYKRNLEMGEYADALLAVWDGESKGTGHMIDIMKKEGKSVYVHLI